MDKLLAVLIYKLALQLIHVSKFVCALVCVCAFTLSTPSITNVVFLGAGNWPIMLLFV